MTTTQSIDNTWNLNNHADFSSLAYNNIILWNDGICFLGYDDKHAVVAAKSITFADTFSAKDFHNLILDEPFLGGGEPVMHLLYLSDKNMLIPDALFDQTQAEEWFKSINFVDTDESILSSQVAQPNVVLLETMRTDFIETIKEIYSNVTIAGLGKHLIQLTQTSKSNIGITVLGTEALIQTYHKETLHTFSLIDATDAAVLYHISTFAEKHQIAQTDISVSINGFGDGVAEIVTALSAYFSVDSSVTNELFFNTIASCAS